MQSRRGAHRSSVDLSRVRSSLVRYPLLPCRLCRLYHLCCSYRPCRPCDPVDLAASSASAASDASDASAFPPAVMHADALVASFERELVLRRVVAAELQYGAVDEQKVAPPVSHTHSYLPIHPHLGRAQPHGWLLNWRGHRANEPAPAGYRTGGPSVPTKSPMCGRAWLLGRAEAGRGRSSGASTTQPSQ